MTKDEFISRFMDDTYRRKLEKEKVIYDYYRCRGYGERKPWGCNGVIKGAK